MRRDLPAHDQSKSDTTQTFLGAVDLHQQQQEQRAASKEQERGGV